MRTKDYTFMLEMVFNVEFALHVDVENDKPFSFPRLSWVTTSASLAELYGHN
jgi:hypothetical protein